MLNSMRGSSQSKTMWVILGLLMLGLTGFGISGLGGGTVRTIGSVGDEPIDLNIYARSYQNAIVQLNEQFERRLSPLEVQDSGVQERVLDSIVGQATLDNETAKRGISVGDEVVRNAIVTNSQFEGLDGTFDRKGYDFFLERQAGLSANEFEELVRKENARSILENAVVGGVSADQTVAKALMRFSQQERSFEWAAIGEEHLGQSIPDPGDDDLQATYDANPADYMTPLTRNITYVWLNPSDLFDQVDVDEDEIRASYDLQTERFKKPELRAVDRLVFSSIEEAQSARDQLDAGTATFANIVGQRGLDEADVDLGEVTRQDLSEQAANLVFAQSEPGIIGPVQSTLGPALIRINAVFQEDVTPFEDARDELRYELAGEAARRLVSDLVNDIEDLLAGGVELEELAVQTPMKLGTVAYFEGSESGITAYEEFRVAATAISEGDFADVLDLSDGGVFALRLNSIEQPRAISIEEVRERLSADWYAAQLNSAAHKLAARLKSDLENGSDLSIMGIPMKPEENVTRNSFVEALLPSVIPQVFQMDVGGVSILDAGNSAILVRLTDITDFDPALEENAISLEQINNQLNLQISFDILKYYTEALQSNAGVVLNSAVITQINTQVSGY